MIDTTPFSSNPQSPLALTSIGHLLLRPRLFFSNVSALVKKPEALIVAWVSGIAYAIGRIDTNMMKADLGGARPGWQTLGPWLTDSWVNYWIFVLAFGVLNGWILWYFGGWWYRKRLQWSGVANADPIAVRATYVYQDLVQSGPTLLFTLGQTVFFQNYAEAWNAEEYLSMLLVVFIFWSCVTSYKAATTYADIGWKARMWFLILPIALYVVALGVIGTLYALLQ